jgi:hypothetical protein
MKYCIIYAKDKTRQKMSQVFSLASETCVMFLLCFAKRIDKERIDWNILLFSTMLHTLYVDCETNIPNVNSKNACYNEIIVRVSYKYIFMVICEFLHCKVHVTSEILQQNEQICKWIFEYLRKLCKEILYSEQPPVYCYCYNTINAMDN